jgi:hypothetical protein
MSRKEKEKLFAMGLVPEEYEYRLSDEDELVEDESFDGVSDEDERTSESDEDANNVWEKYPKSKAQQPLDVNKDDITWTRCSFDKKHAYANNYLFDGCHLLKRYKTDIVVGLLYKAPAKDDYNYGRQTTFDGKLKQKLVAMGFTIDELPKWYSPDDPL